MGEFISDMLYLQSLWKGNNLTVTLLLCLGNGEYEFQL